jgi:hypothetical protein
MGEATSLLTVLTKRGLRLTRLERERITRCRDAKKLKTWIGRAVTAESAGEVFRQARKVH